jgi:alkylation response protein AidB-like acyl-CoA dehydrogenase
MEEKTIPFAASLIEDKNLLRETIRDFAEHNIRPYVMELDESQQFPIEIMQHLGALGFLGILVPEEYGGSGMQYIDYAIVVEEIARIDPSIALSVAAHNGLCVNHINLFANETQKSKYLPALASGDKIGAWGLTEPASGSDAGGMQTYAEKSGDYYILNGTKNFITHGITAETAVIMAITNKSRGKNGISAFIVEKNFDGYFPGKKENKLGMRASETAQIILDNCKVSKENLIGEEGEGLKQAFKLLEGGRVSIAALAVGCAQGCLDISIKYSKERKQFGKPIADFQAIQFKLAEMASDLEAARLMTYQAAYTRDKGKARKEAAMAKLFASEIAVKAANEAVQIFGGYGFVKDYPAEKFYRDVKLLTIGEGTSEIQRTVIAKELLKD